MDNVLQVKLENVFVDSTVTNSLMENRIEALKALASLLLREVESLKPLSLKAGSYVFSDKINLSDEVQRFEEALIRDALIRTKGQQRKAARILNTKVTTLNAKIKRYGIDPFPIG